LSAKRAEARRIAEPALRYFSLSARGFNEAVNEGRQTANG
jgi:hypothetical protein